MTKSPHQPTWRDVLPVHPAADLFPRMSESELRELGEDIRANGLLSPIILYDDGELVDGRSRLDAIELVGMGFEFIRAKQGPRKGKVVGIRSGDFDAGLTRSVRLLFDISAEADPYTFVLSANIHRRHLTTEQKRELIAKVIEANPKRSDRQIAKQTKTSPTTVGKIRKESEAAGDVSKLDTRTDTRGRKQPSAKPKKSAKPAAPPIIELGRSDYSEASATSAKSTSPAKNDPIGSSPVRYSEPAATSVPHLSETAHFLIHAFSVFSHQLKEADGKLSAHERFQVYAKIRDLVDDDNIVEQALRLVERMTSAQRRDFDASLKTRGLIGACGPQGSADEIPDGIPARLRRLQ
jgi:hypothetical protein